jgi:xylulose-5-phosphate/fructose-6-phosphate phosphoketolase
MKDRLKSEIIESLSYAHREGIDREDIRNWIWPETSNV